MSSLLMSPSEVFFVTVLFFKFPGFDFLHFFFETPCLSLHFSSVLLCYMLFFLNILTIIILNFPLDKYNIHVICKSGFDGFLISSGYVFLAFDMTFNFLLKAGHVVSGNENRGKYAISMMIYVSVARTWAVFNVRRSCRCERIQIPLVSFFLSLLLTLGFPMYSSSEKACVLKFFPL